MYGMMRAARLTGVVAVMMAGAASAPAQEMSGMGRMGRMEHKPMSKDAMMKMEPMMARWPKASREAVEYMTRTYGAPMAMTEHMAMWGATGQWKRTVVYDYEVQHDFPAPHTDVMQQWIDYRVPLDRYDEMAMYDGSVVIDRTNGELSARCDKEGANFLAINLAHEIAGGTRGVDDARRMYGAQIMALKAGQPAPYTQRLLFAPMMGGAADPDRPLR